MSARVSSFDHQILRPSRSRVDKAVLAAHVAEIQAGSQERLTTRVRVPAAIVRAWWRVRLPLEVGCLGFVDRWTRRPSWRRVYQEHDLEVRNLRRRVGDFPETTEARCKVSGDRISGFSSQEAEKHVCGVGFYKRRLDVHRSEKLSQGFA